MALTADASASRPSALSRHVVTTSRSRGDSGRGDVRPVLTGVLLSALLIVGIYLDAGTFLTITALVTIALAILSPAVGLATLLIVSPLLVVPLLPAPGFPFILVSATLFGCICRLPIERPVITVPPAFLLLAGFVLFVFVQQSPEMLAGYPSPELRDVGSIMFKLLLGLGAIVAAGQVLRNRSPYPYLAAALGSAVLVAALGLVPAIVPDLGAQLANLMAEPEQGVRQGGSVGNPNYFGNFMAIGAVATLGWAVITPNVRVRLALLLPLAALVGGLAVSQSRGALATLVVGVIAIAFVRGRRLGVIVSIAAAAFAAVAIPLILTNRVMQQAGYDVSSAFQSQALSDGGRLAAVLTGPELFLQSPIFGVGLFRYVIEGGTYSHNYFMTVLAEQGVVGITLWLSMLVAVAYWLARRPLGARTVGFGVLATVVVGSMFLEPPWDEVTFILPAVVMVASLVADWGPTRQVSEDALPRRSRRDRSWRQPADAVPAASGVRRAGLP